MPTHIEPADSVTSLLLLREVRFRYRRSNFDLGPIDAAFAPGVTCVMGLNGAGKSTLFKLIAGIERPDQGEVIPLRGAATQGGVGLLPQQVQLPQRATTEQYLRHIGWLYGIPPRQLATALDSTLSAVGLVERQGSRIGTLSGGMQRRVALAGALLPRPSVLLLDEPTAGLDPVQRAMMREHILSLSDVAVVISTHQVEDVRGLGGTILLLAGGQTIFTGSVSDLEARAEESVAPNGRLEASVIEMLGQDGRGP